MTAKPLFAAAMSGGVDSTVAAALARESGARVVGITLILRDCDGSGGCGSDDREQVTRVAAQLGIEHHFLDLRGEFREKVLEYSWNEYRAGHTPNPCAFCNFHLKFGLLAEHARRLGADAMLTGHYAVLDPKKGELRHAVDTGKDQVYFLALLRREQLQFCRMPLGNLTKDEVRLKAAALGLENARKKESQDACFGVPGEAFPQALATYFDAEARPGDIVDAKGKILGHHQGIHLYTIGQRKGLGVAMGRPAYVSAIDPVRHRVVLSTDPQILLRNVIEVDQLNLMVDRPETFVCEVQTRYRQKPVAGSVTLLPGNRAAVELDVPVSAPAIGQVAAFYDGDLVLGGGIITQANSKGA
jgi:tRNA-specific 2-thiouridylase